MAPSNEDAWPELPYAAWKDTCDTLHLWTQIVGKIRLAQTPWLNHSWHVTLYVTARGLTTSPIPYRERAFQIDFDFVDHVLWVRTSEGSFRRLPLAPMPVARFYADLFAAMAELGLDVRIRTTPCEIADCIPFDQDFSHVAYDRDYAGRFWRILLSAHEVLAHFRTGFLGKASPVHFFWGSFDLAVDALFRDGAAPPHPAACRICRTQSRAKPIRMRCRAPASGRAAAGDRLPRLLFLRLSGPGGLCRRFSAPGRRVLPRELGEFILPYDAVRAAPDPERALMDFLQSTYEAAAELGRWDRAALDCPLGEPGRPRLVR